MEKSAGTALTVCEMPADVLLVKSESPPYCAVMVWVPAESVEVENFA
jgi:hypothetical protein